MTDIVADLWGYCDSCHRWFACPGWYEDMTPQPTCPVCTCKPTAFEDRALLATPRH